MAMHADALQLRPARETGSDLLWQQQLGLLLESTGEGIFGIDLATDQQVAGLLMWVVVSSIYLLLITVTFFSWASREEKAERQTSSGAPRERGAGATG